MKAERILIIDDHALIVEGYKNVLLRDNEQYNIDTAYSCKEGYKKLNILIAIIICIKYFII